MQFFQKLCIVITLAFCSHGITYAMYKHASGLKPKQGAKSQFGVNFKHSNPRALLTTKISKRKQREILLKFQGIITKPGQGSSSLVVQAVTCCLEKYLADRPSKASVVHESPLLTISTTLTDVAAIPLEPSSVTQAPAPVSVSLEPEPNYLVQLFYQVIEQKRDIPLVQSTFRQICEIIDVEKNGKTEAEQQELEALKVDLASVVEALTTPEPVPQPSRIHRIMSWCWAHPRTTLGIGILIGIAGWAIFAPASLIATASSGWQLMTNLGYIITHAQEIAMHTRDIQVIKNILCSVVRPSLRALRQKVAALELVVGVHTGQISAILASLDGINLALGALDGRVDVVEHDVVTIFQRLNATQIEINALPGEILDRIAGQTTFFNLDRSFTSLLGTAASHIPGLG